MLDPSGDVSPALKPQKILGSTAAFAVSANPLQPRAPKGRGLAPFLFASVPLQWEQHPRSTVWPIHPMAPTSLQPPAADFWEEGGSGARLFLASIFRYCYFMPCQSDLMSVNDMREI